MQNKEYLRAAAKAIARQIEENPIAHSDFPAYATRRDKTENNG